MQGALLGMAALSEQCVDSVALSYWMLPQSKLTPLPGECCAYFSHAPRSVIKATRPQALETGAPKCLSAPWAVSWLSGLGFELQEFLRAF